MSCNLQIPNDNNVDKLISIYDDLFDKRDNNVIHKLTGYLLARDVQILLAADTVSLYLYGDTHNVFKRIASSPHAIDNIKMSVFVENVIRSGNALNINADSCYLKDEISSISRQNKLSTIKGLLFAPIFSDEGNSSKVIGVVEVLKQNEIFSSDDENSLLQILSKMSGHFTSSPSSLTTITPRSAKRAKFGRA